MQSNKQWQLRQRRYKEFAMEYRVVILHAVNRRMDDWVGLDALDLATVDIPMTVTEANGK